ncbi:MAG: arabinogalactan endo-1,4-beta-galactosidase [Chitinophagaceae bacterium]|nr:MAG: arabinogalactan endo-1,4-beta-galactosidase [Chitinophagaceae bacterium]
MRKILIVTILACCMVACKKSAAPRPDPQPTPPSAPAVFAKGADISWITEMEAAGRKFYNSTGTEQDIFLILKNLGMNAIRLRVWVNPSNGWNNKADVIAKASRAKAQGMRIMIDFHYSDSWADPGKQTKPAAWTGDVVAIKTALATHTTDVLNRLKTAGVTPEWVQVGNETNDGMLWPEGKASTNMAAYAQLIATGYDAVKTVFPNAKVIVHLSNGWDNALFRWSFDGLKSNGGKWDVIGMSLYPSPTDWAAKNNQCLANMNDMVSRYGKEVMIVEVGMSWDQASAANAFISDLIAKTKSVAGNKGLGVLYWEPQAYNNWQGYTLGAFDNSGRPTSALNAFQ